MLDNQVIVWYLRNWCTVKLIFAFNQKCVVITKEEIRIQGIYVKENENLSLIFIQY